MIHIAEPLALGAFALAVVLGLAACRPGPELVCWPTTAPPLKSRAVCEVVYR